MKLRSLIIGLGAALLLTGCAEKKGYDNMALLYGGNVQRNPSDWTKERLASHITYTDPEGNETWLFDAFLALEIWDKGTDGNRVRSLGTGYGNKSGDRVSWQHFLDWWFTPDNGFDALDQAVEDAKKRIGRPATKRKVVISVPDPIIYEDYKDTLSSTVYWGELDGKQLDFSKGEDRLAAVHWFIDQAIRRWKAAGYRNIVLEGFYCFTEDIVTPGNGWSYELKKADQLYPAISDYVHSLGYTMSWIPYNHAGGYNKWQDFHLDYVMMQPNYLWHPEYSMDTYKESVRKNGLSMELELDGSVMSGRKDADSARERFYRYMEICHELDLYGKRELSYYLGSNTLNDLKNSSDPVDQQLYHDFCRFVAGHKVKR